MYKACKSSQQVSHKSVKKSLQVASGSRTDQKNNALRIHTSKKAKVTDSHLHEDPHVQSKPSRATGEESDPFLDFTLS